MDLSEYLQEESRIVPAKPEIEAFMDGVDILRSDVDRLHARVERLAAKLGEAQQPAEPDKGPHDS
jgi:ubiquinone biosynthesis protein UbiJ